MKQLTCYFKGNDLFIDGIFMGTHGTSVGPYGNSTGIYAIANTTCPITEWADKHGVVLYDYKTLKPLSRCR